MTDDLIGTKLGQYELIELVRRGGMGAVYKAHQPSLDRFVAIKVMFHSQDPQFAVRFKREARAIAQLQHPNILPIYDYNEQGGIFYLVLQYVEGGTTLTDILNNSLKTMDPLQAVNLIRRLLGGLEYAHRRGIIHRDIKPGNVLMPDPDWPMLADFGLAKLVDDTAAQLTMPGLAMGTAAYMAPEQALAQTVDARTDLYAIGVMLYEMLTGRIPFDADQPLALLTKHLYELPPPPTRINPGIPAPLEQIVLRTLAKSPAERFQTATEMSRALEEMAIQLRQGGEKGRLSGLYQAGVLAFAEGRWDQAVEHLSKLVTIDPQYEDGADLLSAAQEAGQRAREDARQQIERVRQRRSSVQPAPVEVKPEIPAPPPESDAPPATPEPAPADAEPHQPATGETMRVALPSEPLTPAPSATGETMRMTPPSEPAPQPSATGETMRMTPSELAASQPSATGETMRMTPSELAASQPSATGETMRMTPPSEPAPQPRPIIDESAPTTPLAQPAIEPRPAQPQATGAVEASAAAATLTAAGTPDQLVMNGAERAASPRPNTISLPTPAAPDAGAPASRGRLPLIIGGAVALLLLVVGGTFAAGMWSGGDPTAGPAPTEQSAQSTAAPEPSADAPPTAAAATAAPTAPIIAAPPPSGQLVLEEPFNGAGELTGFVDRKGDQVFSRGFHAPGVYHVKLDQPNSIGLALLPRQIYRDATLQVDMWDESDQRIGEVFYGLAFRAQDASRFYALLLDARTGRYTVRKYTAPDTWTDIVPWKDSPVVSREDGHNLGRIDTAGDTISIYLNEQQIESFSDSDYPSGMFGFFAVNTDGQAPHFHYDNLAIWSADAPPAAPELPATRNTPFGEMALIPGGPFVMGDNERDDAPPHVVSLANFYIDRAEVTNAAYAECVANGACVTQILPASETHPNYATQAEFANFPVLQVTWQQAAQFCAWAGKRLPTEAEWEKAATWSSAQGKVLWPFGNTFDPALLNSQESGEGDTTAVDAQEPEINGTLDMAGNLSEWTSSLNMPYPYNPEDGREDPGNEADRIYRGGSWAQTQGKARGALRQAAPQAYPSREIGFRCAAAP